MLAPLNKRTLKLLDLADYIANSTAFNQGNWHECIAGHCCQMHGIKVYSKEDSATGKIAADLLGLSDAEATSLFSNSGFRFPTKEHAAKVVRNFALTNVIDWTIGEPEHDRAGGEVLLGFEPVYLPNVSDAA